MGRNFAVFRTINPIRYMTISTISTRRLIFYAAIATLVGVVVWFLSDLLGYVMLAWVISLLGRPLVRFYRRIPLVGDVGAAIATLISFAVGIAGVAALIVPAIMAQAHNLSEVNYARLGKTLQEPIAQTAQQLRYWGWIPRGKISAVSSLQQKLIEDFEPSQLTYWAGNILGSASSFLVVFGIITFILFFFLKDEKLLENAVKAIVPLQHESKVQTIFAETSTMLTRYVTGLLIQLTVFTVCIGAGLWFWGVDNALLIGFIGGLFNLVPYIGPIVASAFGLVLTVSSNLDVNFYIVLLPLLLRVLLTFWATQLLDNFILHPMIFSNSVKAHPLEVFMVVLLGAKLGGAPGMILATPLYTTAKIILKAFFREYRFVQFLTGNMDAAVLPIYEINDEEDTIEQAEIN